MIYIIFVCKKLRIVHLSGCKDAAGQVHKAVCLLQDAFQEREDLCKILIGIEGIVFMLRAVDQ